MEYIKKIWAICLTLVKSALRVQNKMNRSFYPLVDTFSWPAVPSGTKWREKGSRLARILFCADRFKPQRNIVFQPKRLFTEDHRNQRFTWAQDNQSPNWDQMIITGGTTIDLNKEKGCVWNLHGRKEIVQSIQHPTKVNVWVVFKVKTLDAFITWSEILLPICCVAYTSAVSCHQLGIALIPKWRCGSFWRTTTQHVLQKRRESGGERIGSKNLTGHQNHRMSIWRKMCGI